MDHEAVNDMSWEVSAVLEMEILAMMLAGLGLLGGQTGFPAEAKVS